MTSQWRVRLAHQAEQDIADILLWTADSFGAVQAAAYSETLSVAIEALLEGPDTTGAKARDDISAGIRLLHVARYGRHGRHFILFRVAGSDEIDVLRVLHDSMDLSRHVD